jgi:hypothetical protein
MQVLNIQECNQVNGGDFSSWEVIGVSTTTMVLIAGVSQTVTHGALGGLKYAALLSTTSFAVSGLMVLGIDQFKKWNSGE